MTAALELQLWGGTYWVSGNRLACRARQTPPGDCHSISSTVLLWLRDRLCSKNRNNLCNDRYLLQTCFYFLRARTIKLRCRLNGGASWPSENGLIGTTKSNRHLVNWDGKNKRKMRGATARHDFKSEDMELLKQETESGSSQPWYK